MSEIRVAIEFWLIFRAQSIYNVFQINNHKIGIHFDNKIGENGIAYKNSCIRSLSGSTIIKQHVITCFVFLSMTCCCCFYLSLFVVYIFVFMTLLTFLKHRNYFSKTAKLGSSPFKWLVLQHTLEPCCHQVSLVLICRDYIHIWQSLVLICRDYVHIWYWACLSFTYEISPNTGLKNNVNLVYIPVQKNQKYRLNHKLENYNKIIFFLAHSCTLTFFNVSKNILD